MMGSPAPTRSSSHLAGLLGVKHVDQVQPKVAVQPEGVVPAAVHHLEHPGAGQHLRGQADRQAAGRGAGRLGGSALVVRLANCLPSCTVCQARQAWGSSCRSATDRVKEVHVARQREAVDQKVLGACAAVSGGRRAAGGSRPSA